MPIIKLENITLDFGNGALLDNAELQIKAKDKICLVGRNGTGKTSLLKLIQGQIKPDSGNLWTKSNLKIAVLEQNVSEYAENLSIFDVVASGIEHVGDLLKQYHELLNQQESYDDQDWLDKLAKVQKGIDHYDGWQYEQKVNTVLDMMQLDPNIKVSSLSGGLKRRILLAKALVLDPDILLLDEPTNHLDIASIEWLENYLLDFNGAILCISHDRFFVDKIANKILELDRGKIYTYPGNFDKYIALKAKRLEDEEKSFKEFDKKLKDEEIWIRQGVKARRTRNEGRVRSLKKLREERSQRQDVMAKASFTLETSQYSGQIVLNAHNVSYGYNDTKIIKDFYLKICRGDKLGIIGPNGCGKTTLINVLLKKLNPDTGNVKLGTNLEVAYFDQLRSQIDPELSVLENVAGGRSDIIVDAKKNKTKHIYSYLNDFLFTPDRARCSVKMLSGGECNRMLLAKLFSNPQNFLVLDEPTNDLDIETLELLEDILINYTGTVLLISHDRQFVDNVVTQVLVFEDKGKISEYVGGYSDWYNKFGKNLLLAKDKNKLKNKPEQKKDNTNNTTQIKTKNSQKQIDHVLKQIDKLEKKASELEVEIAKPDFYNQEQQLVKKKLKKLDDVNNELSVLYLQWNELE